MSDEMELPEELVIKQAKEKLRKMSDQIDTLKVNYILYPTEVEYIKELIELMDQVATKAKNRQTKTLVARGYGLLALWEERRLNAVKSIKTFVDKIEEKNGKPNPLTGKQKGEGQ